MYPERAAIETHGVRSYEGSTNYITNWHASAPPLKLGLYYCTILWTVGIYPGPVLKEVMPHKKNNSLLLAQSYM